MPAEAVQRFRVPVVSKQADQNRATLTKTAIAGESMGKAAVKEPQNLVKEIPLSTRSSFMGPHVTITVGRYLVNPT